jgi:exodeoxyribonuclease V beta subunit
LPPALEKITAKKIGENVNKGHLPPVHPLFDLADRLWTQTELLTSRFDEHLRYLRMEIVRQGRMELPRRKERRNILAYDDLLNDLYGALRTERGHRLAEEIRSRFQAVLIDEFQDTDPVQYTIFKSLFLAGEGVEQRPFFVIGDPKQAIYAFRGADIFAYIEAARAMNRTYTLKENWRSEPGLLQAVNTLFGAPQKPFLYEDILYRPVTAADQPDRDLLLIDNLQEPPFQWWLIPEETEDNGNEATSPVASSAKGLAKTGLYAQVAASVASEVARLIRLGVEGRAKIGDKVLQAEDIALLVRTNREADIMREALTQLNIPHVVSSRESVFHAPEAEDVRRILAALAEPRNPALIRAALVTDIMGMTGDDIHELSLDEAHWEEILRRFHQYHALWAGRGFIRMFRSFLENEQLPSRILKYVEGERRLTNLLHIGELLHQAATTDHLAMHDLIKWLSDQINSGETQPEEYELRLEREEKAVKVVTIHKSKGLEYPIVFCPFFWGNRGPRKNRDHVLYHDPAQAFAPILDFGSAEFDNHLLCAEEESLAEDTRLLYVALTRARHRTYYIWGRMQHAEHSASAYLFHQGPDMVGTDLARAVRERYRRLSVEDFRRDVETIAGASGHTIRIEPLPAAQEKPYRPSPTTETLTCRQFTGNIDATWKVASYTQLVASNYGDRDRYDDEPASQREMKPAPEEDPRERLPVATGTLDMFGFPGGTKAGIFLHDILEKIDYRGSNSQAMQDLILEKLAQYGYDPQWAPVIMSMMEKVTNTPFPLFPREKGDLTLSQIRPEDRRNEVEFYFPLRRISRDDMVRIFRKGAAMPTSGLSKVLQLHCLERLQFSPLQGYLKGFIDLLFCFGGRFYLVDWKSNHLGNQQQNYGSSELLKVMDEGYYFIQYHLYSLALHQYLAFRIPEYRYEDHFGGVYYCFLRGMDPNSGSAGGVFHDRPPLALLEMMKEVLIRPPGI